MEREFRYWVIKHTDVRKYLTNFETNILVDILSKLEGCRMQDGRKPLKSAVIESDWPEYEPVWKMIEDRVDQEQKGG